MRPSESDQECTPQSELDTKTDPEGRGARGRSRRGVLKAGSAGILSILTTQRGIAADEDTGRSASEYDGGGSIENAESLAKAVTTQEFFTAVDSVEYFGKKARAEVFSASQSFEGYPTDGDDFGVISTGLAENVQGSPGDSFSTTFDDTPEYIPNPPVDGTVSDSTTLRLTFTVPEHVETVEFDFAFGTEEIPEYTSSEYQDFFIAEVVYPDGTAENAAQLPDGSPVTVANAAPHVSTPAGIKFNRITEKLTASFNVSDYQGEQLTVNLAVGDVGDSRLDSGILFDGIGFRSRDLKKLVDSKDDLIGKIRNEIPEEYLLTDRIIDKRPQEFVNSTRTTIDSLNPDEQEQYAEAFRRLQASEQVTHAAAKGPVDRIISRTGNAVLNALLTVGIEAITFGVGSASIAKRSTRLIGDTLAANGRAVNNSIIGSLGRGIAEQFARFSDETADDFGRITEDYFQENPRAYRKGLTREQKETLVNTLKEEGIQGSVNAVKAGHDFVPDDLLRGLTNAIEEAKTTIEALFFSAYWFETDIGENNFSVPDVEVPDKLSKSFDVSVFESRFVDDTITVEIDIPTELQREIQDAVDSLESSIEEASDFVKLARNLDMGKGGIEGGLSDSTDLLVENVKSGSLSEQNRSDRNNVKATGVAGIENGTNATTSVIDAIGTLIDGVMYLSLAIGVTAIVIYAIVVTASAIGGVSAPLILPETGLLLTILGILGLVDIILVLTRVAMLGGALSMINSFHLGAVAAINASDIEGGEA